jgi:hypothetical protein
MGKRSSRADDGLSWIRFRRAHLEWLSPACPCGWQGKHGQAASRSTETILLGRYGVDHEAATSGRACPCHPSTAHATLQHPPALKFVSCAIESSVRVIGDTCRLTTKAAGGRQPGHAKGCDVHRLSSHKPKTTETAIVSRRSSGTVSRVLGKGVTVFLSCAACATLAIGGMRCARRPEHFRYAGERFFVTWMGRDVRATYALSENGSLSLMTRDASLLFSIRAKLNPPRRLKEKDFQLGPFGLSIRNARSRASPVLSAVHVAIRMPAYAPIIVFGLYPCVAFVRGPVRRYRRAWRGRCLACGYSLRGLAEKDGVDAARRIAAPVRESALRSRQQLPRWILRGATFGALTPLARLALGVLLPDNASWESSVVVGLLTFPAMEFGFAPLLPAYLANVALCALLFATCSVAWTAFGAPLLRGHCRIVPTPPSGDVNGVRCPECGAWL